MTKDEALQRIKKLRDDLDQCHAEARALADFFWVCGAEQSLSAAYLSIAANVIELEKETSNDHK